MNRIKITNDDVLKKLALKDYEEFSNLREFKFPIKYISFLLKICSLKLYRPLSDDFNTIKCYQSSRLTFENQLSKGTSLVKEIRITSRKTNNYFRLISFLYYTFILYIVIKFSLLIILSFRENQLQKKLIVELRKKLSLNEDEECATNETIYNEMMNEAKEKVELELVLNWLNFLGYPFESLGGVAIFSICFVVTIPIVYFASGAILMLYFKPEANILGFIYTPVTERIRMRQVLMQIIDKICESIENTYHNDELLLNNLSLLVKNSLSNQGLKPEEFNHCPSFNLNRLFNTDLIKMFKLIRRHETEKIEKALKRIAFGSIIPANLDAYWHQLLMNISMFVFASNSLLGVAVSLSIIFIMIICEVMTRTNYRFEQFNCEVSNKSSVLINMPLHMRSAEMLKKQERFANYERKIDTLAVLAKYVIEVELDYFFKPAIVLTTIEYFLAATIFTFIAIFYFNLYTLSYFHRFKWMIQIERQLRHCCDCFDETPEKLDITGTNTKLNDTLLETYLNYELFRRYNANYLTTANFFMAQAGIFCCANLGLCYLLVLNIYSSYNFILLIISVALVFFLNIYLISSAYTTAQVRKLVKQIFRLQTKLISKEAGLGFILNSWRRQILTELDARKFFAPSFIGNYLSYIECLTFNSYFVALFLVLVKSGTANNVREQISTLSRKYLNDYF